MSNKIKTIIVTSIVIVALATVALINNRDASAATKLHRQHVQISASASAPLTRLVAQFVCNDTTSAHCVRSDGEDTADAVATYPPSAYVDPLAACKKQILANMVFPGTHCPNVMEDDPRLNNTWNEMYTHALACIDKQFDTGIQCEYGTQAQRLSIYSRNEQGDLFIS